MYSLRAALLYIITLEIENTVLCGICLSRFLISLIRGEEAKPRARCNPWAAPVQLCVAGAAALGGEPGTEKYFGHSSQVLARLAAPTLSVAPLFSGSFHGAPALCADLCAGSTLLHPAAPADFPRRRIALRARAAELPGISHTDILQPGSLADLWKVWIDGF